MNRSRLEARIRETLSWDYVSFSRYQRLLRQLHIVAHQTGESVEQVVVRLRGV